MRTALVAAAISVGLASASMLATTGPTAVTRHRCEVVPIAGKLAKRCDLETIQGDRVTFYRQTITPYGGTK